MSTILGTTLNGRYRLEARIGSGGMSTVYRALDETLQRQVAIKLMNREVATDSDQLERFRREARAVAQLSHPNVVGVIDAGEDEGRPYIVFEYVEGETLKERIRRMGRLPIAEAVAYAIEIARALGAAHARHIVHRDVKPQNVLIDEEGSAKVTDFGIARTLDEEGLTADGRVLGTTDYVSPEQAPRRPVTPSEDRSDWPVAAGPRACSGEPQSGAPTTRPSAAGPSSSSVRAIPKSVTLADPSSSISTFCGLTSRWTICRLCAAPSARAISIAYATASGIGSRPRRRMRSLSVSPSTHSNTI